MGTDLFRLTDYFWEIDYIPEARSNIFFRKLKAHFNRQGIPDVVISDKLSVEFKKFIQEWGFTRHILTCLRKKQWESRIGCEDSQAANEEGNNVRAGYYLSA